MYALVDCNNFYVSCERVFQPQYRGKPVVVLSNNDGCAIARSEEAKALGIEMAVPIHYIQDLITKNGVKLFSSNYTLYGDMSRRIYEVLAQFSPHIENYSIDESFLFLGDMPFHSLERIAISLRRKVAQWTGIPVSVGLARTKTLAKLANRYAKKMNRNLGVYSLDTEEKVAAVLRWCEIGEVWGIGRQYATKLRSMGVATAYDFTLLPEEWVRKNMTVVGQRMFSELRGLPSIKFEEVAPPKKGICTSRSFGTLLTDKDEIKRALSSHAARCAEKLRKQGSCTGTIQVFLETNQFRELDKQYNKQVTIKLPMATNSTNLLIVYGSMAIDMLYKKGYNFHKTGMVALDIVPQAHVQGTLYPVEDKAKNKEVMKALDSVNAYLGRDTVRFAAQGYSEGWKLKMEHLSKCYTTRLDHVIRIKD
ncbi:Y-family DNA polymerase [Flavisolibacter sp. BT320]|nr:Y-family DNA polymerase [Flavisolibacter longurius]RYZ50815.1 MAG: Y-family DNA polymerase [Sphingobacteriales bacterium]